MAKFAAHMDTIARGVAEEAPAETSAAEAADVLLLHLFHLVDVFDSSRIYFFRGMHYNGT